MVFRACVAVRLMRCRARIHNKTAFMAQGLCRLESLQLRHKLRRRKHASQHRGVPPVASRAHERWSMNFIRDALLGVRA